MGYGKEVNAVFLSHIKRICYCTLFYHMSEWLSKNHILTRPPLYIELLLLLFFVVFFFFQSFHFLLFCIFLLVRDTKTCWRRDASEREWGCIGWRGGVGEGWKEVHRLMSALHEVRASHFHLVYSLLFHSTLFSILFSILTPFLFHYFLFFPIIYCYIFAVFILLSLFVQ